MMNTNQGFWVHSNGEITEGPCMPRAFRDPSMVFETFEEAKASLAASFQRSADALELELAKAYARIDRLAAMTGPGRVRECDE